ncbi:MAG TPA: hypothetical protein VF064_00815 [Pyrinomonadaceae bacterium]
MGTVLGRFVKVLTFTAVLAVLGPVLIVAALYFITGSTPNLEGASAEQLAGLVKALGVWFGVMLLIGFVLAIIGMSRKFTVPFSDRDAFIARLDDAAKSVRYRPQSRDGDRLVYKPPFIQRLAEKIHVEVGANEATVNAPLNLSGKLRKKLREG